MSVNLSIKNVPNELAKELRRRALRHHRSLQGELMTILTECLIDQEQVTVEQAFEQVRKLGLHTRSESKRMIRRDRDAH